MNSPLFRQQAIDHLANRHLGTVRSAEARLDSPRGFLATAIVAFALICLSIWLIGTSQYARRHEVLGHFDETNLHAVVSLELGNLVALDVTEGQRVQVGHLLGRVVNLRRTSALLEPEITAQLKDWQQLVAAAKVRVKAKLLQISSEQLRHQALLELTRRDMDLQQSKVDQLEQQVKRMRVLRDRGYLSNLDWISVNTRLISEKQHLNALQQSLITIEKQIDNLAQEQHVEMGMHRQEMAQARLGVSEVRQQLIAARSDSEQLLIAPASGRITRVEAATGSVVKPGQPLIYLSTTEENYSATVYLTSQAAGHIEVGETLELELDAYPAEHYGKVSARVTSLTAHRVALSPHQAGFLARLDVSPHETIDGFLPGMGFRTHIRVEERSIFSWVLEPLLKLTATLGDSQ